jgi:hypothetical protein
LSSIGSKFGSTDLARTVRWDKSILAFLANDPPAAPGIVGIATGCPRLDPPPRHPRERPLFLVISYAVGHDVISYAVGHDRRMLSKLWLLVNIIIANILDRRECRICLLKAGKFPC